jgi:GH18 family chitinase
LLTDVHQTTKDFCGTKTVKRPSCEKGDDMLRVVGYFESWAKDRPCEVFNPEDIPIGLYTHINFAFGSINPETFQLEANTPEDKLAYERLTFLKKRDKNLKIYLAVGGWTFNDPGRTAHIFSELAASSIHQHAFQESVESFLTTYNFDGLDLDWEYPVDDKRGGRERDYITFPKFMTKLKRRMNIADKGLTITLPASYWYLQYFDIKNLVSLTVVERRLQLTKFRKTRLTSSTLCLTTCTARGTRMSIGPSPISTPTPT